MGRWPRPCSAWDLYHCSQCLVHPNLLSLSLSCMRWMVSPHDQGLPVSLLGMGKLEDWPNQHQLQEMRACSVLRAITSCTHVLAWLLCQALSLVDIAAPMSTILRALARSHSLHWHLMFLDPGIRRIPAFLDSEGVGKSLVSCEWHHLSGVQLSSMGCPYKSALVASTLTCQHRWVDHMVAPTP